MGVPSAMDVEHPSGGVEESKTSGGPQDMEEVSWFGSLKERRLV